MTIAVKVIPRSARTELAGQMADGSWKVRVAAPPEGGRANEELCAFLARHYCIPRDRVTVIAGQTGTRKLVKIEA